MGAHSWQWIERLSWPEGLRPRGAVVCSSDDSGCEFIMMTFRMPFTNCESVKRTVL